MVTAVANLFASESKLGVLGLALAAGGIGVMFAAFLAAKVKAFQATKATGVFEKGGPVLGKRHSEGGTLIEAEHGEYVTNRSSTAKYRDLVEAINEDDSARVRREALKQLLEGTSVGMSEQGRRMDTAFMQNYGQQTATNTGEELGVLRKMLEELHLINGNTNGLPKSQMVALSENKIMTVEGAKTTIREIGLK